MCVCVCVNVTLVVIAAGYGGRVFAPFHVIECNVVGKRAIEIEHGFSSKYFVLSFFSSFNICMLYHSHEN